MPIQAPTGTSHGSSYKNKIREYLIQKLGVKDLLPETWVGIQQKSLAIAKKFEIHYVVQNRPDSERPN